MNITQFFIINQHIVIFVYGLVFFLMGFGILLKNRQYSRFSLAKHLHWLALFGIVHAFADWGHLFIPIHKQYASEEFYVTLRMIRIIINALSFTFLFQFGISLLLDTIKKWYKLKYLPVILFILWFLQLILYINLINIEGDDLWWVRVGDIWSRYILALSGGILSAFSIYIQRKEFDRFKQEKFIKMLYLTSISLIAYSLVAGVVVPKAPLLMASFINSEIFFLLTGIPIEVFRALLGLIMALSTLSIIRVFDKEYVIRIQESEKEKAIINERNRIAQDLHDGIIQSIYASNLQLEVVKHLIKKNPAEAEEKLSSNLIKRNQIIGEIRQYIGELRRATETGLSLKERIEDLVDEMDIRERLKVKINYTYEKDEVTITVLYHLALIIKEAISNVIKHAKAKELLIKVQGNPSELRVKIIDDGIGFSSQKVFEKSDPGEKQGIKNMIERTKVLDGKINMKSTLNEGTTIEIILPYPGGLHDKTINS